MSAPGLAAVAAWDTPLLDGAVYTLEAVAERLPPWRARMDAVARSLADAECWSGPAASVAATALGEVSAVVTAVTGALDTSLGRLRETAREARTAQELAEQAVAAAAASGTALDGSGGVVPPVAAPPPPGATAGQLEDHYAGLAQRAAEAERVAVVAADAMAAAARAAAAAAESADPLAGLGARAGARPPDFAGLATVVLRDGVVTPSCLPVAGTQPASVAAWWAALSGAEQEFLVRSEPRLVGSLDGLPGWARDRANRVLLDRALADPHHSGYATARAVEDEIEAEEAAGRTVQLWTFDADDSLVALAYGDLDTAEDVAVLVPGVGNGVDDLDDMGDDAQAVADAARAAAPGAAVAAIAWLGYRPPGSVAHPAAMREGRAATGGRALAGDLAGLRAARAADPLTAATALRTTVVAHSYGTVVVDLAAEEPGVLDADALVLLGSPGMDGPASDLEVDEVFESSSPSDLITHALGVHGGRTDDWDFGATSLPTEWTTGHTQYLDADRPTIGAVGEVVVGAREPE